MLSGRRNASAWDCSSAEARGLQPETQAKPRYAAHEALVDGKLWWFTGIFIAWRKSGRVRTLAQEGPHGASAGWWENVEILSWHDSSLPVWPPFTSHAVTCIVLISRAWLAGALLDAAVRRTNFPQTDRCRFNNNPLLSPYPPRLSTMSSRCACPPSPLTLIADRLLLIPQIQLQYPPARRPFRPLLSLRPTQGLSVAALAPHEQAIIRRWLWLSGCCQRRARLLRLPGWRQPPESKQLPERHAQCARPVQRRRPERVGEPE